MLLTRLPGARVEWKPFECEEVCATIGKNVISKLELRLPGGSAVYFLKRAVYTIPQGEINVYKELYL